MTSQRAPRPKAAEVTLLTQPDCSLCKQAKTVLTRLVDERLVTVREVDLADPEGRDLAIRHAVLFAPGVLVDGQPFSYGRLSEKKLRRQLARSGAPTPT
ncbi:glutaredoxin family protein [Lapillicoccus sp.]|uniref:glutaredoxin family protein n=1 Tax=Lapillicoccus sp. TaxID=1909287 RepID=UPI003982E21D